MIEILTIFVLLGLLIASHPRMGFANPFQIYFFVWFLVVFGYYLLAQSFIPVGFEFLLLIFTAKAVALLLLLVVWVHRLGLPTLVRLTPAVVPRDRPLFIAQALTWIAIPFAYQQAINLSGGSDIFTVPGYIQLRSAMTVDGEGFGLLAYFSVLSYVVCSLRVFGYAVDRSRKVLLILAVIASLFFAYIGTGRTGVLLLVVLIAIPLVLSRHIGIKGGVISVCLLIGMFALVATMTAKGVSVDAEISENVFSLLENLRAYTIAPFLAFSEFVKSKFQLDGGVNTFRFFISLVGAIGFEIKPVSLIRDYAFVPDATNVYTVYETYFRDFSYLGVFVPPLFLVGHWWLYRRAMKRGGPWVFYYAASVYPLLMQFFQDQYFSLMSMWMQVAFFYWLLCRKGGYAENLSPTR